MPTLADCLGKAGQIINDEDRKGMLAQHADLIKAGMTEDQAAQKVVNEFADKYGKSLNKEINDIRSGEGMKPSDYSSRPKGDTKRIERDYTRKATQLESKGPETETAQYKYLKDIPEEEIKRAAKERLLASSEIGKEIGKGIDENTSEATKKKISDAFDKIKIKSDAVYALPIPPPLWNGFVEIVKQAVLKGKDIFDAIKEGIQHLRTKNLSNDELDASEMEIRERFGLNKDLRENASKYINSGRSDAQIISYLKRQGASDGVAKAILGDAKANPISKETKFSTTKEAEEEYFKREGEWLGRKAVEKFKSHQEARVFQQRIKDSTPKKGGVKWQDVDRAIHVYLDLKRNPDHLKAFYNKLTPEQKGIVDLSQNLTPEQKAIADDIRASYDEIGLKGVSEGVISDILDNYVSRAWEFEGKPATEMFTKFKTGTRHNIQRTLDTILEGWAAGYKLKLEGATNNLQSLKVEINNVLENKRLLDDGLQLKVETGDVDINGDPIYEPLFTTSYQSGYKKIENPLFRKWEYAGKLEDYEAQDKQNFGRRRDIMVSENGTVMKKSEVYAPESVAKSLNNILGHSGLQDVPGFNALTKFTRQVKFTILSLSGFHYIAFTRVHELQSTKNGYPVVSPITAYKGGLRMIEQQNDHLIRLIENGMTINRQQDFNEAISTHETWLGKQMDKLKFTKEMKDKTQMLTEGMHRHLFETYGAGLKAFDGVNLLQKEMRKNPQANVDDVSKMVAKQMNDAYGGINWERMHGSWFQNPTVRHLSSLLLLAPDWTASNLRFAKKAFEAGDEGNLYRRAWARVLLRGASITAMANAALAFFDEKDDDGNPITWEQAFVRRYAQAWQQGYLRSLMVDVTPLYRWLGGDESKRAYFSVFGAYIDPVRMMGINPQAAIDAVKTKDYSKFMDLFDTKNPISFFENKSSWITKLPLEMLTSQNWQHKEFTNLDELLGMDDKGEYAKTIKPHQKGDISPYTHKPYVKDQTGHEAGDKKGGKLEGELTKYAQGGAHPIHSAQLPSFILSEVRGMMPIMFQQMWQAAAGENDWTYSMLNAVGSGIMVGKAKPDHKQDEPQETDSGKPPKVIQ